MTVKKESFVGTTDIVGKKLVGGGRVELMVKYDEESKVLNVGFRGSVYSKPIRFAEGFVTGLTHSPRASLVIDFALQVKVNPGSRSGIIGVAHDAYPSYNIRVNGKTIYNFQQHKIPILKLDPPIDVFKKERFSY